MTGNVFTMSNNNKDKQELANGQRSIWQMANVAFDNWQTTDK